MSAQQIADNVWSVGVKDPELAVFDIIMPTEYGTTYNAYLIKGEKIALVDTVKKEFTDEYLANLQEITPLDKIDYLIVNHNEPDHSGAIRILLEKIPNLKIICSAAGVPFVKNIINVEADITGVKDDHTLDLGGKTLTFKLMPYMHWPDTLMDYLVEDKILFSNDGFAAHYCGESLWADDAPQDILDHEFWYYWDAIMRPFTTYQRRNLAKLDDLDVQVIATSHGPLYRKNARAAIDKYVEWAADKTEGKNQVTIFYASNYGNTYKMARLFEEELGKHNLKIVMSDITSVPVDEAKELIENSKSVMIGTPTFNGDAVKPVWDLVALFSTVYSIGKKAAVFGSYGWGGEGIKMVADRLGGMKLKVYEENFRARLVPGEEEIAGLKAYADKLAEYFGGK